jgi:aspartyl-tRNA(Asn)/glutamyl-tRNA(Gln) amidotransferase subunit C
MTGEITSEDVAHVAKLARLEVSDEEIELFTGQLGAVLEYADAIRRLDTADVPPTAHPFPLANVVRRDEPQPCLDREEVLAQAPLQEDSRFRVPRILAEEP